MYGPRTVVLMVVTWCTVTDTQTISRHRSVLASCGARALPSRDVLALIFSRHRSRAGDTTVTVALSGDGQRTKPRSCVR